MDSHKEADRHNTPGNQEGVPLPSGNILGSDGVARPPWALRSALETEYFDQEWGRPVITESGLLERICLEAFQSGLSWATVLAKRPAFRSAFFLFDANRVTAMSPQQRKDALRNPAMIRNPLKHAAIYRNAEATIALRDDPELQELPADHPAREILGGAADRMPPGLPVLVWSFVPESHDRPRRIADIQSTSAESEALAKELKRRGFTFVGPTTCYALMQAIGMVNDRVAEVGISP